MRALIFITLLLTTYSIVTGQIVQRLPNETTDQFVYRMKVDSLQIAHTIIESTLWTTNEKAIIVFLGFDSPNDGNIGFNRIFGKILFPLGNSKYKIIKFDTIEEDGGHPEIISVFFVNSDDDQEKEIGVLCKYSQNHYDYYGILFHTFIYDNPTKVKDSITYNQSLLNEFSGCECDFRESPSSQAKFKTAKDIKDELKKRGY